MRYHSYKPAIYASKYGERYSCDHPVYSVCTLYRIREKGLAVIQQRYNPKDKTTWWGEIDPWLTDMLYVNEKFKSYFDKYADISKNGIFPTVTIRQIMWAFKMKPLPKEKWETVFDRRDI